MKVALKAQFDCENQYWIADKELMRLKHMGQIQVYIKSYTSVLLEIKDMSDEYCIHQFMKGL